MKFSNELQQRLRCPVSGESLVTGDNCLFGDSKKHQYPIIDGIPILINEENSIFCLNDFVSKRSTTFDLDESSFKKTIRKLVPKISNNIKARKNYSKVLDELGQFAKILVVGGSIVGEGMECIYESPDIEILGSDVSFGPHTKIIFDAHDIPFVDQTFDCVIVQAVLEHVLDPYACVREIHRVLKPTGLVYAETPFIQQVHMGKYDYTRFTHLGHRRLFRCFTEVDSGPSCGPGMALAWSYRHFLTSFSSSPKIRSLLMVFAYITSFYLKYFDFYLIDSPGSYDAASAYFFMGRKSDLVLSDRELLLEYKGML